MKIREIHYFSVEVEDEEHLLFTILLQPNGQWKCSSCNRFHCTHAHWVAQRQQAQNSLQEASASPCDWREGL
jgi:hypothetical protein